MACIRITLEDDDGREINGDKERLYDVSGGATCLVDIEAAVENLKMFHMCWAPLDGSSKLIPIDEQPNHQRKRNKNSDLVNVVRFQLR